MIGRPGHPGGPGPLRTASSLWPYRPRSWWLPADLVLVAPRRAGGPASSWSTLSPSGPRHLGDRTGLVIVLAYPVGLAIVLAQWTSSSWRSWLRTDLLIVVAGRTPSSWWPAGAGHRGGPASPWWTHGPGHRGPGGFGRTGHRGGPVELVVLEVARTWSSWWPYRPGLGSRTGGFARAWSSWWLRMDLVIVLGGQTSSSWTSTSWWLWTPHLVIAVAPRHRGGRTDLVIVDLAARTWSWWPTEPGHPGGFRRTWSSWWPSGPRRLGGRTDLVVVVAVQTWSWWPTGLRSSW
jgi:hypothetical protein